MPSSNDAFASAYAPPQVQAVRDDVPIRAQFRLRPVYDGHVEQQQISRLEIGADAHLHIGVGARVETLARGKGTSNL